MTKFARKAFKLSKILAREAGLLAMRMRDGHDMPDLQSAHENNNIVGIADLVTKADVKAQELILNGIIDKGLNRCGVIAEEKYRHSSVRRFTGAGSYKWTVDPIDGTLNFKAGSANPTIRKLLEDATYDLGYKPSEHLRTDEWGPMIGMLDGQEIIFGVAYLPKYDKLFFAQKGHGSFLLQQKMSRSLLTSQHERFHIDDAVYVNSELYKEIRRQDMNIKRHGSYAFTAGMIANGSRACIIARRPKLYDAVPPICIVKEAGGAVLDEHGSPATLDSKFVIFGPNENYVKTFLAVFKQRFDYFF